MPFPALRLNDIRTKCEKKGDYDEVYIFEGNKEAPTIVHFVMINKSFRKRGKKGIYFLFSFIIQYQEFK